jgi:hypothetical protein
VSEAPQEPGADVAEELRRLGSRVETLQTEVRRLATPSLPPAEHGWADESSAAPVSYAWLSALEAPTRRTPQVPRLVLEGLFLIACASAAGLAELDAVAIAAVMVGAWVLVALIEWAASRADRRREQLFAAPPLVTQAQQPVPSDPSWFVPPVEHTLLDNAESTDSVTAVTSLPRGSDAELETTSERRAAD